MNSKTRVFKIALFTAVCALISQSSRSEVKLPAIFGSDMVLQQGVPVKVWGWASPGEAVSVSFGGDKAETKADEKGEWKLELPAQKASAIPAKLVAKGANEIVLDNVLVGEVWLCSGQSNMEMTFGNCFTDNAEAAAAAAKAGDPQIRIFPISRNTSSVPLRDFDPAPEKSEAGMNKWKLCTPEILKVRGFGAHGFSAVGYYFARELAKELKVPVGLLWASWSGTAIGAWTAKEGFTQFPSLPDNRIVQFEDPTSSLRQQWLEKYLKDLEGWKRATQKDAASMADDPASAARKQWLEDYLKELEAWQVEAKKALDTKTALDRLPPGQKGGVWEIACDTKTGLKSLPPLFCLWLVSGKDKKEGRPTYLFNGMISPIIPFQIRGVIWYQGENQRREGALYTEMTKAHVGPWRQLWGAPSMPYYLVQIAPFEYGEGFGNLPPLSLPLFWEAQYAITREIPNTGIAGTTDIGDMDLHPKKKEPVGRRLALQALKKTYGKDVVADGPAFKSFSVEGSKIRVLFDNVPTTLKSNDGKDLTWFEVIDADKDEFVGAKAEIDGKTVVLSAPGVEKPVGVRFGWHKIAVPNLVNAEGLPAYPFRAGNEKAMRTSMPAPDAKP